MHALLADVFWIFLAKRQYKSILMFRKLLLICKLKALGACASDGAGWSCGWLDFFLGAPSLVQSDINDTHDGQYAICFTIYL
jgi:hypothetical protein